MPSMCPIIFPLHLTAIVSRPLNICLHCHPGVLQPYVISYSVISCSNLSGSWQSSQVEGHCCIVGSVVNENFDSRGSIQPPRGANLAHERGVQR